MSHTYRTPLVVALLILTVTTLLLTSCGGAAQPQEVAPPAIEEPAEAMSEPAAEPTYPALEEAVGEVAIEMDDASSAFGEEVGRAQGEAAPAAQEGEEPLPAATPIAPDVGTTRDPSRKIIKNADMIIEVESVDIAMSRIGNAAAEVGGYVLETRTDLTRDGAAGAVVKIAVPVDRFEATLERIRETATRLISEHASGTDVSQEYVDVQSQIDNLEATQARVREFLEQATTVEESLRVNAQLNEIERQISQLKGRLQYLAQRTAFSTITVQMQQVPPDITPTPTATPPVWSPGDTANQAYGTLSAILQAIATVAIWVGVVGVPLSLPVVLIWLIVRGFRHRSQQPRAPGAAPVVPPSQESAKGD